MKFIFADSLDYVDPAFDFIADHSSREGGLFFETDPARARKIARAELELYLGLNNYRNSWLALGFSDEDLADGGSDHLIDSLVGWGDEDALRGRIDAHLKAGATQVCIKALAPDGSTDMRLLERLAPSRGKAS